VGQVRITDQADADLLQIATFIAEDKPDAARRLIDLIDEKCRLLASSPEIGWLRNDLSARLRSFPVGSYIIFYRPIEDGIEVIRVLHGARDLPSFFE